MSVASHVSNAGTTGNDSRTGFRSAFGPNLGPLAIQDLPDGSRFTSSAV